MREGEIRLNDDDPLMQDVWFFYPYDELTESEPLKLGASVQVWDKESKEWSSDKVIKSESTEITFQKRPDLFCPEARIILYK